MGKCRFCGRDAGFLRSVHKECQQAHDEGIARILDMAIRAAITQADLSAFEETLRDIAATAFINDQLLRDLLARAWGTALSQALEDDSLSEAEERALLAFKDHFSLPTELLDKDGAYQRMVKAGILRDILEGNIRQRVHVTGMLPFNLQKGEILVWLFQDVPYYESRTRTAYSGGYSGVSLRVAKGVYFRTGGFRGNPVATTQLVLVDKGLLGITNRHIYFAGDKKAFRIRYDKIAAVTPYSDGVGIHRDAVTAKPQFFVTEDGWFTYNLIANLTRLPAA